MTGLIAIDLDGTLLADDHQTVPPQASALLTELARRGVQVVPASGRAMGLMAHELAQLDMATYVISSNGASVIEQRKCRVLRRWPLPRATVQRAYDLLRRLDASFELYHGGVAYLERDRVPRFLGAFSPDFAQHLLAQTTVVESMRPLMAAE